MNAILNSISSNLLNSDSVKKPKILFNKAGAKYTTLSLNKTINIKVLVSVYFVMSIAIHLQVLHYSTRV